MIDTSYQTVADQVVRLHRTASYPNPRLNRVAFDSLVTDLTDAAVRYQVDPSRIIDQWDGDRCPRRDDFLRLAAELTPEKPEPADAACRKCGGTGFEIVYYLHTREGEGDHSFVKKEPITRLVYEQLSRPGRLDRRVQAVYTGAKRCDHQDAGVETGWTEDEKREHDRRWAAHLAQQEAKRVKAQPGVPRKPSRGVTQADIDEALKANREKKAEPGKAS